MDGHRATFRSRDYRFDERLLRRRARREAVPTMLLAAFFLAVASWLVADHKAMVGLLTALCALIMFLVGWASLRHGRAEAMTLKATRMWFENSSLFTADGDRVDSVSMDVFKRVVVQKRGSAVRSVLVDVVGPGLRRWRDLDDMDAFAREFERRLPSKRVTTARWLHR